MPRVSRACAINMVPNLPAPISPTVTGRPAASRSSSFAWRFMHETETQPGRGHKRRLPARNGLLAEGAGDEGLGGALGAGRAPRHIDFGRTDVCCRHVDALPGLKAFCLAHNVCSRDTVGSTIGRQLAFFMAAHCTGRRDASDSTRGIFGALDRRFGRVARRTVEAINLLACILK